MDVQSDFDQGNFYHFGLVVCVMSDPDECHDGGFHTAELCYSAPSGRNVLADCCISQYRQIS